MQTMDIDAEELKKYTGGDFVSVKKDSKNLSNKNCCTDTCMHVSDFNSEQDQKLVSELLQAAKDKDWFEYFDILNDCPHLAYHPLVKKNSIAMGKKLDRDVKIMDKMCG